MELSFLEKHTLLLANEDYSGLWEVFFEAKDMYKGLPQAELLKAARNVIMDLLENGLIQLYWCAEPLTNNRVTLMTPLEVSKSLSVQKYWDPPKKDSISIRFIATKEGEEKFRKK